MPLVDYLLSGLASAGIGEDPFLLRNSSLESHIYKWGEFLGNGILNVHICFDSLLCNVATLSLNVAMFQRRDVTTSRRSYNSFWNVATWSFNVATSILSASVTSRRGFPTSRRGLSVSL